MMTRTTLCCTWPTAQDLMAHRMYVFPPVHSSWFESEAHKTVVTNSLRPWWRKPCQHINLGACCGREFGGGGGGAIANAFNFPSDKHKPGFY